MPRWVVTLPPQIKGPQARGFAEDARRRGADLLEVRTDLHSERAVDAPELAKVLGLVVSERGAALSEGWIRVAEWVDRPVERGRGGHPGALMSHHAERPLAPERALEGWRNRGLPRDVAIKHVEPVGEPRQGLRLLRTQELLEAEFGPGRVTVLAMGPLALPFRCLLAARNALEYVAASPDWMAAPGQRLLADAARAGKSEIAGAARLAILGSRISGSRSPRIHPQPFDRIDLPEDAPVGELVDALHPHYRGFAITSPFKKPLAAHLKVDAEAINTLVRRSGGWGHGNTDVDGARAVLARIKAPEVVVLGEGGATAALKQAAQAEGVGLRVLRRADAAGRTLSGWGVWTWPQHVGAPEGLAFNRATVVIIAYGQPARAIGEEVRRRGGTPVFLGGCWFAAQARGQRRLWEAAT